MYQAHGSFKTRAFAEKERPGQHETQKKVQNHHEVVVTHLTDVPPQSGIGSADVGDKTKY